MRFLPATLLFFSVVAVASPQFEEKPIRVTGVLSLEVFPGPPNYESVNDGEAREEAWILTTAKKERFQLVIIEGAQENFATLRRCLGRKAVVAGTSWPAHTGHHHTAFLITVASIQEEPNKSLEPTPRLGVVRSFFRRAKLSGNLRGVAHL
jgi:hypothetical protein